MKAKCEQHRYLYAQQTNRSNNDPTLTSPPRPPQQHTLFERIRFGINER